MKKIDLLGKRFGRLVVLRQGGKAKNGQLKWICQCDCGNTAHVLGCNLRTGNTISCGCYHKEQTSKRSKTHGRTHTREYRIWENMKKRCLKENNPDYPNYGGRGITICSRWMKFENFYEDMGDSNGLTIDRINNEGNYEPSNCRWATQTEQNLNQRIRRTNKSGVSGVRFDGDGWVATFCGRYLGRSKDFHAAYKLRKKAEKEFFKGSEYEAERLSKRRDSQG